MASSTFFTTGPRPHSSYPFSTFSSDLPRPTITLVPAPLTTTNPAPNSNSGGVIDSGALYLYTFLATLVLLLSVSCAIVFRSLLIRRRRNRYIAQAIANGTWIPRSPFRDPGTIPTLFEARVSDAKHPPGNDELEWDAITPFSATYVNAPSNDITSGNKAAPTPTTPRSPIARLFNALPIRRPSRPRIRLPLPISITGNTPNTATGPALPLIPVPSSAVPEAAPSAISTPSTLRVAVLIAMPSPSNSHGTNTRIDNGEEIIPHVEFGVTEVGVHSPETNASGMASGPDGQVQTDARTGDGR